MKIPLELGPDVLAHVIPHRRPFLMIDGLTAYERTPRARVWTHRHIAANDPIFEGHFPGLSLWPGALTIEGLGQSCNVLFALVAGEEAVRARGADPDRALDDLRNLELGYRLAQGHDPVRAAEFLAELRERGAVDQTLGMSAAVDVKLVAPVFAGQRIDFSVTLTRVVDRIARFEVEAEVAGKLVAHGVMMSTRGLPVSVPR